MDIRRLARTDLNLLVALQVLLEEQNVSRAAERLFITQSAMSKTLSRLRELLDDPLFTRSAHGMVPTPRAIELHPELDRVLQQLDALVGEPETDPQHFQGVFHIVAIDHFSLPVVPSLMEILTQEAPEMGVKISQDVDNQFRDMAEGRADLAIAGERTEYADDILVEPLCTTRPIFLMRSDHPLKELEDVTWRDIMQYPQVALKTLNSEGSRTSLLRSQVNRYLNLVGLFLETPDYLGALQTLARTDAIMFAPRLSLDFVKATGAITSIGIPGKEGRDNVHVVLMYHKRTRNSPKHIWMRHQIKHIYSEQQKLFDMRKN